MLFYIALAGFILAGAFTGPLLVSSMCLALWFQDFLILSRLVDCECAHINSCQSNIIMIMMSEFSLKIA